MHWFPADGRTDTAGRFQGVEEGVLQEGRIARERIPGIGGQVGHARHHANQRVRGFRIGGLCFKMHVLASVHQKMNLHEYQAKHILRSGNINTPRGIAAASADDAANAARELGGNAWVVKAQIHAGGRGKAGGVKVVKSLDDVKKESARILGSTLVTHQTGPHGKKVNRLYIEEGSAIDREFYLSALVDRETSRVAFVVSTEGGMDIEEVAHKTPEKILTFSVDPATGIMPHHCRRVAQALKLSG